jgi:hypothetical protein
MKIPTQAISLREHQPYADCYGRLVELQDELASAESELEELQDSQRRRARRLASAHSLTSDGGGQSAAAVLEDLEVEDAAIARAALRVQVVRRALTLQTDQLAKARREAVAALRTKYGVRGMQQQAVQAIDAALSALAEANMREKQLADVFNALDYSPLHPAAIDPSATGQSTSGGPDGWQQWREEVAAAGFDVGRRR